MNIIELYIDGKLCDTGKDFGVRLNRQLLNPAELNAKDAQYSYSVNLPPTAANNAAFGYSIIEETKDKFNRLYAAELYVNSVIIFKGNFKLSEISDKRYKGNLYIPAAKSIKDIFGDIKLADNPEYRIEFKDFAEYISKYNKAAANGPQMAIFPYALYGVLPKVPLTLNSNNYSARDIWDASVRLGMQDLAPSINPLLMLKHIFKSKGYKLSGTAFDDERLTRLYMSYKNETDYIQPWNYGYQAFMKIRGYWSNVRGNYNKFERNGYQTDYDGQTFYSSDLLDATNTDVNILEDPGANILYKQTKDENNNIWTQCQIYIPSSGFYKIRLKSDIEIDPRENWRSGYDGMQFVGGDASNDSNANSFRKKRYEIKLLRDRGTGDFGLSGGRIDKVYYRDNLNQNNTWDEENIPKYFPNPSYTASGKERELMLVDPAQNPNYIMGMAWGWRHSLPETANPLISDNAGTNFGTVLAAKSGLSWDVSSNPTNPTKLAIPSIGYMKYGYLSIDDENEEDPEEETSDIIDWEQTNKFKIVVNNAPESYARKSGIWSGNGEVNAVVWLDAGEILTIASVSDEGRYKRHNSSGKYGWTKHAINFELDISPFRTNEDWLQINSAGNGTGTMDWNDPINFDIDSIDLVKFLPADVKTDDFIENFCKAFNLILSQTAADSFTLNVKQTKAAVSPLFINLDGLASVQDRTNSALGLPSMYKIGFTIDQEEEGYTTTKEDGGGSIETGAVEESIVEQKSNFSYNWFKDIQYTVNGANITLPLPIISKAEVWANTMAYPDAMRKRYTNLAARFWYFDGLLNDINANIKWPSAENGKNISIAKISNYIPGLITLNYKDENNTILDIYFTVLVNSSSHYTILEGYISPEQYERLDGAIMAMFNGDQYYIAEISGYDPLGRNKTKIKLIRKI